MQEITNSKSKPTNQKAEKVQRDKQNETQQITNGKIQELEQEVANLKALVEIMRKEIDALNALVRYLEQRKS
ncbi:hypothetical protein [Niastella populi]|uniref:Uncharacterized protein n=1 Tax=Niastella populi TaxID=550983 RepID=A0A1V9ET23_9BACT|nr:hypothetical protein [Niastella populi]OQP49064.1 hypothetical protein A4R26_31105 [Niastella populi]